MTLRTSTYARWLYAKWLYSGDEPPMWLFTPWYLIKQDHLPVNPLSFPDVRLLASSCPSVRWLISFSSVSNISSGSVTPLIAAAFRATRAASLLYPFRHNQGRDSGKTLIKVWAKTYESLFDDEICEFTTCVAGDMNNNQIFIIWEKIPCEVLWGWNMSMNINSSRG